MTYLMSILMGLIQGVAEFLPISSSGHLALFQAFFGMENVEEQHMFFTVLLHFGTLISVCIVYWRDIVEMIREFFLGIAALFSKRPDRGAPPPARRLVMLIILGTLPLFVMVFLKGAIEALFVSSIPVSCMLLLTGFILFFSDRLARGRKTAKNATVTDALLVGCAQAVAIIPGISRSGATISAGMMRGFDRNFAVRFSFLLSLPAIVGANILELKDAVTAADFSTAVVPLLPVYLVGVLAAAVVGYFAIRLVKSLADKGKFGKFAYYCWGVGAVSLIAGILKFVILK
ncbi:MULTISPECIES: undecaprenyl-diphosphate phosphatase [Oscillospiraceae]|uniref:Undecaprenyl-diphosphatase n=1 Tax=Lawsonibacter faecis TaxID=2763052 RepID=A0A8J6MDP1_9FIRM|nr:MULTISPECIES: undecaprenyl-diphosphate phosphatase [Oscillospiraceae]MTQ98470.1 undecaprenyl-diphosphate phosphatase [Pseudoflavonifractor sp. BIOML-A16]MTR07743.1 undecaprenyl-diphosphate phosphatase [Pseudoflavonifractor sp. BIOML-A15]MTR33804.1 undecaprenyl-diphosphate phosphatase [Pseudoflavonifractor sp. BIOML-A14]MTR74690.1 undecaprenyl-diphosphate phosphatase [Pseudoflavonifractor sp. BIOML-A18]MTS65911.1 undecaprenyl-diphosphate phosphatase [Pseudoflavonifractor sp. BIOML-A5]MTS732